MPDIIKLLSDSVANQIAAGEVIQRPASVIKELVENAVDADADDIIVLIKDSGKTLIQVIDNGTGMSETDARLAFERHATSKISSAHDLFAIRTKGFRGEALASIAAVAMVELRTRMHDSDTGIQVIISGSHVEKQEPCSCPPGSSFSVKNLFFNIPARRKFLKTDNTEMRHIVNEFQKIALAHPAIKFSLIHNDTEVYNLPSTNLRQRIIGIFGAQIKQDLITLQTETSLISISGFIGKPENARRTYGEQFFFVNNRFMKHPYFHKAVAEAYQNILPSEAIPSYFIYMEADPATIDINIHPTKTEIKFEDERAIWQILMASVREALGRFNIVPSIDFDNEGLVEIPVIGTGRTMPEQPQIRINPSYNPFDGEERLLSRADFTDRFDKEKSNGWEKLYTGIENNISSTSFDTIEARRKFFQIKNKYIVCQVKSGLMLIDQKRAHERILYERFQDNLNSNHTAAQTEMFPVTVNINPSDFLVFREIENELRKLGFMFEDAGENRIKITGRPVLDNAADINELLEILIEEYKSTEESLATGAKEKVAAAMAGASAIPYGKFLEQIEMEEMFDSLFACKSPNYSPKGKPIINIISMEDIDKRFG
ncbi:MAG TPA: DNA mismatch repair endonuclease MutL [Bacteroidales bacterium]|nr:DNA mismatch repair endonuclease MutL [Bacteroidales bacterium]